MKKKPTTARAQLNNLFKAYAEQRTEENRNALITASMPLVVSVAEKLALKFPKCVDVGDLVQWGALGLIEAVKKYDPNRRTSFPTYARQRILGSIIDEMRKFDDRSRKVRERQKLMHLAETELASQFERKATDEEIAARLNLSPTMFRDWTRHRKGTNRSLQGRLHVDEHRSVSLVETIANSKNINPEIPAAANEIIAFILARYRLTDALIMRLYYFDGLPFSDIGECIGRTESCVSVRHTTLIRSVRARFAA